MRCGFAKTLLLTCCALALSFAALTGTAAAAGGYSVTFVARECPSYGDIYASKARNDETESLRNLGPDSQYGSSGALVSPAYEDVGVQSRCRPLRDAAFTLGRGYRNRRATGVWASIAGVTEPYATSIVTERSTALLGSRGSRVAGAAALPGAVTIRLTRAEALAAGQSRLWVQGGVSADPLPGSTHGGPMAARYGFGTLRCADDDIDGANVQRILFPSGTNHVFCYAYYVAKPPAGGTIVIHQRVEGGPDGFHPAFPFRGDLSYDRSGFTLKNGQSIALARAAGATWQVTQPAVDRYKLASVTCTSRTGRSATSTSGRTLSVALAAGDIVSCTFVSRWVPPIGNLTIVEITEGGTGSFDYIVEPHDDPTLVTARTRQAGVPSEARPERNMALLATELYSVQELPSARAPGRWPLAGAECDGTPLKLNVYDLRLVNGKNTVCTFTNRLVPAGSISLSDVTQGGTGTSAFVIESLTSTPQQFHASATTIDPGVSARAAPDAPDDATAHVYRGRYRITLQPPLAAPAGKQWKLNSVSCNGRQVPFSQGSIDVTLTRRSPHLACTFTTGLQGGS